MVMYLGKVAEVGTREAIYENTKHPYSAALLASMPKMDPAERTEEPPLSAIRRTRSTRHRAVGSTPGAAWRKASVLPRPSPCGRLGRTAGRLPDVGSRLRHSHAPKPALELMEA